MGEGGIVLSPEAEAFKVLAPTEGLKSDHLGQTFSTHGETYKVTGLNSRATKMPIQADRVSDGARFKFPVSMVKSAFDLKERFAATGS